MSAPGRSIADSVLHLARTRSQLGIATPPGRDAADALSSCLTGTDPVDARSLAQEWLAAAERALQHTHADEGDQHALILLGQALQVPVAYFIDLQVAEAIDAWLLLDHRRDLPPLALRGPCRGPQLTAEVLASIHTRLLHELSARSGPPPAGR